MKKRTDGAQLPLPATRAAIYLRVSTEEQKESGLGIEAQRTRCKAMIDVKGWTLVKEYNDEGISGTKEAAKRPALAQLLDDAAAGRIDAVVVLSLDRLGRKTNLVLSLVDTLARDGAALVSCKESLDTTTAAGNFVLTMFAALAQLERDLVSERTSAALTERGASKGYKSGRVPLGYVRHGDDSITIDQGGAAIVARIFAARRGGLSMAAIADMLNREGVATAREGAQWYASSVREILINEDAYNGGERYTSGQYWPAIIDQGARSVAAAD